MKITNPPAAGTFLHTFIACALFSAMACFTSPAQVEVYTDFDFKATGMLQVKKHNDVEKWTFVAVDTGTKKVIENIALVENDKNKAFISAAAKEPTDALFSVVVRVNGSRGALSGTIQQFQRIEQKGAPEAAEKSPGRPTSPQSSGTDKSGIRTLKIGSDLRVDGVPMITQVFGFDAVRKVAGPITEVRVMSGGPSVSSDYRNSVLDLSYMSDIERIMFAEATSVFEIRSVSGRRLADIVLGYGFDKSIYVSDEFVVFADDKREVEKSGPFVTLYLGGGLAGRRKEETFNKQYPDARVKVFRDDKLVFEGKFGMECVIEKAARSSDIVRWQTIGKDGNLITQGQIGFPIRGAIKKLIKYHVDITESNK
jgi:hypothetical protein